MTDRAKQNAAIKALLETGMTRQRIADALGLSLSALTSRIREIETPAPPARPETPRPAPSALMPQDAARAALVATGGRYAELRAYAEAHGLTFTQAQQRWHRLGLPLKRIEK